MIAACPRCKTRYRIEREKMRPEGVRLRCSRCETLFRVRAPESAPQAAPAEAASPASEPSLSGAMGATPAAAPAPGFDPAPGEGQPDMAAASTGSPSAPADGAVPVSAGGAVPVPADGLVPVSADGVVSAPTPESQPPSDPPAPAPAGAPDPRPESVPMPAAASDAQETDPASQSPAAVCLAIPDEELAKQTADTLASRGCAAFVVHDGVEAILEVQRRLPKLVVVAANLPKMFGFQVCELIKRNESLRSIQVVLIGAIHHKDRYRRAPDELYGADAYVEEPDLPDGLLPWIERLGADVAPATEPSADPTPPPPDPAPPAPAPPAPELRVEAPPAPVPEPPTPELRVEAPSASVPEPAAPTSTEATPGGDDAAEPEDEALVAERQKAERLARIIVSDIVLYNEVRFNEALRMGNVVEALSAELAEGRALFAERVDERVRQERDHLAAELERVAETRKQG